MKRIAFVVGGVLAPGIATAHPDHASSGAFGLVHYLSDPFHLALAGAFALVCLTLRRRAAQRQPVQFRSR